MESFKYVIQVQILMLNYHVHYRDDFSYELISKYIQNVQNRYCSAVHARVNIGSGDPVYWEPLGTFSPNHKGL